MGFVEVSEVQQRKALVHRRLFFFFEVFRCLNLLKKNQTHSQHFCLLEMAAEISQMLEPGIC